MFLGKRTGDCGYECMSYFDEKPSRWVLQSLQQRCVGSIFFASDSDSTRTLLNVSFSPPYLLIICRGIFLNLTFIKTFGCQYPNSISQQWRLAMKREFLSQILIRFSVYMTCIHVTSATYCSLCWKSLFLFSLSSTIHGSIFNDSGTSNFPGTGIH